MSITPTPIPETKSIDLISIETENWYQINISINWFIVICIIALVALSVWAIRKLFKKRTGRRITLNGMNFGIGDFSFEFTCDNEVQEIAYQLWVELTTRKIAIPLDDNDVIEEIYNSWYSAFDAIRELLKSIPGKCLKDASELIDVTTRVLNEGLRPHLTTWQAKFRIWYEKERKEHENEPPQVTQKRFPEYEELFDNLKTTNDHMVNFAKEMKIIAFPSEKTKGLKAKM